jgi:hypothetical protein
MVGAGRRRTAGHAEGQLATGNRLVVRHADAADRTSRTGYLHGCVDGLLSPTHSRTEWTPKPPAAADALPECHACQSA